VHKHYRWGVYARGDITVIAEPTLKVRIISQLTSSQERTLHALFFTRGEQAVTNDSVELN